MMAKNASQHDQLQLPAAEKVTGSSQESVTNESNTGVNVSRKLKVT